MTASTRALHTTVVHPGIKTRLVATCLAPWTLHLDSIDFCDVDIARVVELANVRFRSVNNDRPLEEVLAAVLK